MTIRKKSIHLSIFLVKIRREICAISEKNLLLLYFSGIVPHDRAIPGVNSYELPRANRTVQTIK